LQTAASFARTLEAIYEIDPDRIALYNWAYLPKKLGHQRRIDESTLPSAEERFAHFSVRSRGIPYNCYVYFGMVHFAKPADELTLAPRDGTLQRNFLDSPRQRRSICLRRILDQQPRFDLRQNVKN
jgi:oxygen-independent coproporphyrinogen-3 oxidase